MTRKIFVAIALIPLALFMGQQAFAFQSSTKEKMTYHKGLEGKFYQQAHLMIKSRDGLGLTDEQVTNIRDLLAEVKKSIIKQDAGIKTLELEINTLMWEAPFETDKVNELIGLKYKHKQENAKYIVSSLNKLHKILSKEQLKKFNRL